MAQQKRMPFWLIRFKNFIFTLLRNKMAFTGLVILSLFTFVAVLAPVLTPYDPQGSVVAGQLAPPGWITLIQGDVGFSQNTEFKGLTATASGNGVSITSTQQGDDSVTIVLDSTSTTGGTIRVSKSLP